MMPLIARGNKVVVKPSEVLRVTSDLSSQNYLMQFFAPAHVTVMEGGFWKYPKTAFGSKWDSFSLQEVPGGANFVYESAAQTP